ncbi:ornithine decarboxylase 1-like [Pholidichthys leucotaenia]
MQQLRQAQPLCQGVLIVVTDIKPAAQSKRTTNNYHPSLTANESAMPTLSFENNEIEIGNNGRSIKDIIDCKIKEAHLVDNEKPFYIADLDSIVKRHHRWVSNLPRVQPFYAVKCNNIPAVIRVLNALDTGFDCASKAEIKLALSLGVKPDKIIYAHPTKPVSHIKYASKHAVDMMTCDSEEELLKMSLFHARAKTVIRIAVDDSKSLLRLSSKFGARLDSVEKLLNRAKELGLEVIGVSFHVGCMCLESMAFKQAIEDARHVFDLANSVGFRMNLLDIGGGFPGNDDFKVKFEELSEVINESLDKFFPPDSGVKIIAEPGRYYVESAFTLAVNIIAKKVDMDQCSNGPNDIAEKKMIYYINDGVYGSLNCLINNPTISDIQPYLHRGSTAGGDSSLVFVCSPFPEVAVLGEVAQTVEAEKSQPVLLEVSVGPAQLPEVSVDPASSSEISVGAASPSETAEGATPLSKAAAAVDGEPKFQSVIWGPTCDSIDKICEDFWIPELQLGDWLLIDNMGAYSVSSSSDFNGFERAHIYPVVTAETGHILNLSHTYSIVQNN